MTELNELKQQIEATLKKAGIGYEDIRVFGVIRCNARPYGQRPEEPYPRRIA